MWLQRVVFLASAVRGLAPVARVASTGQGPVARVASAGQGRGGAVFAEVGSEMGFQMQTLPMVSTGLIAASFGWLRWKVNSYNAKGDELDVALSRLRDARVQELTSGTNASSAAADDAAARVDALREEMEAARAVDLFGVNARIRVIDRSRPAEKSERPSRAGSPRTPRAAEAESPLLGKRSVRILALASTVVLLLPILLLLAADPMAPPSPALTSTLSSLEPPY